MLEGGLIPSLVATFHTWRKQATCAHGPWLKDVYPVLNRKGKSIPSAHCKKCWKRKPQADVLCRDETREEWIERATGPGGVSLAQAVSIWNDFEAKKGLT